MKVLGTRNRNIMTYLFLGFTILIIFINLSIIQSPLIGIPASLLYLVVSGAILGKSLFDENNTAFELFVGLFLAIGFLGLVSWLVMIIYNLNIVPTVIVLCIVTSAFFLIQLRVKNPKPRLKSQQPSQRNLSLKNLFINLLYLVSFSLTMYLLYISRAGEVTTVWLVLHPTLIPLFFATTLLLVLVIFSSQKVEYKFLLIIAYSILSHSFFFIVFPGGDLSGQQYILSRTQLVYRNVVFHGIGLSSNNILTQIYQWFRGDHFQAALTVILARMTGLDVFWVHLTLVPLLWGTFVPVGMFFLTKALSGNENVAVFSALLVSVFPYTFIWGAISVYISFGYIFFLFSLSLFLKYLTSNVSRTYVLLMLVFSFLSFISHFLTGIISFSFLVLAATLKYLSEERESPFTAKFLLLLSFILATGILPLALVYRRFFYPEYTYFGIDKLSQLSKEEVIWTFLIGEYFNFRVSTALIQGIGPVLGLLGLLYYFYVAKQTHDTRKNIYARYLFLGFLMLLLEYRILKLFIVNVPFSEERIWVFRDFLAVPFMTILVITVFSYLYKSISSMNRETYLLLPAQWNVKTIIMHVTIILLVSSWVSASIYYAYPHYGPLQTTSYELEAVKYIHKTTEERYVVISDQWIIFAGGMIVGTENPNAFYFLTKDPIGVRLFLNMKAYPSFETMKEAMTYTNTTVAYFIIEKPRLGEEEYNRIIQQAQQNGIPTYKVFYYNGEEKLRIFYHRK